MRRVRLSYRTRHLDSNDGVTIEHGAPAATPGATEEVGS